MLVRERLTIRGNLGADSFLPWIMCHAARLGVEGAISHADTERVDLDVCGPADLIDAMEMGCLLGPIDVWVDTVDRVPSP
jgi:hypothetical protein